MTRDRKLMTSKSVFERIRWDPNFRTGDVVVVYEDRFLGEQERAFDSFNPTRIPYSRVVRFLRRGEVLWDRKLRLDRIFGSGETAADDRIEIQPLEPSANDLGKDTHEVGAACFDSTQKNWDVGTPFLRQAADSASTQPLRALSFNILHNTYDNGTLRSAERRPLLLRALKDADADILGLQEVTSEQAAELLSQPWIRRDYSVSNGRQSNSPNGLMLFSRHPMSRVVELRSGPRAFAQVASVDHPTHKRLVVGIVHLTSDHHKTATEIRRQQIGKVLAAIDSLGQGANATILMGDFNFGDEHLESKLSEHRLWDVWPRLHPNDVGYTFDPTTNGIAAANSTTGRSRRLDRVFLDGIDASDVALELFKPRDETFELDASDHYGLSLSIQSPSENVRNATPTHRSALVLLVPEHLHHDIQARRRQSDRSFERWMPHVNLLYGFVPDELLEQAAAVVSDLLAEFSPFEVSLGQLRSFEHRQSTTLWLAPTAVPEGAIVELQARLAAAFPKCVEQSQKSADGFTPHLTVGQLSSVRGGDARRKLASALAGWQSEISPIRFPVASVALISRRDDDPFEVRHLVPFGGDAANLEIERATNTRLPSANDIARSIGRTVRTIESLADATVHVVGSARYADRLAGGDVDLVLQTDALLEESALADIAERLNQNDADSARVADDAAMPSVRAIVGGRDVDIVIATPAAESSHAHSAIALADWLESKQAATDGQRFVATVRAVRLFASRRQIDKQALGFPGGVGWALLAADAFASRVGDGNAANTDTDDVIATLAGIHTRLISRASLALRSPVPPHEEILRTLWPAGRRIVTDELKAALDRTPIVWPQLFAPIDMWRHPSLLEVAVDCVGSSSAIRGWLAKVALGSTEVLAKESTVVRPYLVTGLRGPTLLFGLETSELAIDALQRRRRSLAKSVAESTA